jgi:hypothetical protein
MRKHRILEVQGHDGLFTVAVSRNADDSYTSRYWSRPGRVNSQGRCHRAMIAGQIIAADEDEAIEKAVAYLDQRDGPLLSVTEGDRPVCVALSLLAAASGLDWFEPEGASRH